MADPDLQIRKGGGGGGHSDPEINGPHFGLRMRGGGWAPRAPPLDPPLRTE